MNIKGSNIIKRYPLVSFFVLTYIIMWAMIGLIIAGSFKLIHISLPVFSLFLLGAWSPIISASIISRIENGKYGMRDLLSGYTKWKVDKKWYLIALSPVIAAFLAAWLYSLFGGRPSNVVPNLMPSVIFLSLILNLIFGPLGEEGGWRGFALPRLQKKYNALKSSVIIGIIWACWHIPLWFIPNYPQRAILFPMFLILCISYSIILTWIYNNLKGNLAIPVLFMLSANFSAQLVVGNMGLVPLSAYFIIIPIIYLVYALVIVAVKGPEKLT